jgi:molybdopterin/thiamine biosynthesis adenylyltransferase
VVGTTPGLIAMVQATEVLKYVVGSGELLANRLFLWDGMRACVDEIALEKDPSCNVCGEIGNREMVK